jgi:hypothetical protein
VQKMKAVVFRGVNDLRVEEVPRPRPNAGEAVIRVTATTICGTDVHIVKGEYPVRPGLILGHEPVGVIHELGDGLEPEYAVGQRVIVGAITPCGQCFYCFNGAHAQCHGPLGGWRFGNTINVEGTFAIKLERGAGEPNGPWRATRNECSQVSRGEAGRRTSHDGGTPACPRGGPGPAHQGTPRCAGGGS